MTRADWPWAAVYVVLAVAYGAVGVLFARTGLYGWASLNGAAVAVCLVAFVRTVRFEA